MLYCVILCYIMLYSLTLRPCGVYYNIKLHLLRDWSSIKQSKEQMIGNEGMAELFGGGLDMTTNPTSALRCMKYVFYITNLV